MVPITEERPDTDDLFQVLANPYRRRLLVALLDHNPQDDVPITSAGVTMEDEELERLLLEFRHVHLPKLDEYGFVDWNREHEAVVKGPQFDEIRPLLELLDEHGDELPDDWL